jgi:hypothetical protein
MHGGNGAIDCHRSNHQINETERFDQERQQGAKFANPVGLD